MKAADVSGLTAASYVDIKPDTSTVKISSRPLGGQLLVDGQTQQTDLTFGAVVGTLRTLEVKPYWATPYGFYKFSGWSNGLKSPLFTYEIPVDTNSLIINYTALPSPGGNGLLAEYYSDRSEFTGQPTLVRVDPAIDFDWGNKSPDSKISSDNFVVRWLGKFQRALFGYVYNFYRNG